MWTQSRLNSEIEEECKWMQLSVMRLHGARFSYLKSGYEEEALESCSSDL